MKIPHLKSTLIGQTCDAIVTGAEATHDENDEARFTMHLSQKDKLYLISLLTSRKDHLASLLQALESMGEHAFINEGLINEGAFKTNQYQLELNHASELIQQLREDGI